MVDKPVITAEKILGWVLDGAISLISLSPSAIHSRYYNQLYSGSMYDDYPVHKAEIRRKLRRYQKYGWIIVSENGGRKWFQLSDSGRKKLLEERLKKVVLPFQEKWDGYWRLVLYDLSGERAAKRNLLRKIFLRWGLCHLQKSVFIYPYPCEKEVKMVIDYYDLGKSVWFFTATQTDNEPALKKFFHMPP